MRQSQLVFKTQKTAPKDEEAVNAQLLVRAGFIHKTMAGVYSFLPFGLRVLNKIENIIRSEMNVIGGQEILMPGLHPKEFWQATGRWNSFDSLFKLKSKSGGDYALGPSHEEILYPLLKNYLDSYRDLPISLYQIQTKFRDETRVKSGLLRNREFRMKDLYSFHLSDEDRDAYYQKVKKAYFRIFKKLELPVVETIALGGTFSEKSEEFQVIAEAGEDIISFCGSCRSAVNKEITDQTDKSDCLSCGGATKEEKSIEVGNIFPLKDQYAKDFNLTFKDKNGVVSLVSVGCYGLGVTRAMGTIVEIHHDQEGIIWPAAVAPFHAHLIDLGVQKSADEIYDKFVKMGFEVLYDDRTDVSAGEKFKDADLIGIPWRIVASEKTIKQNKIELKKRGEKEPRLIAFSEINKFIRR